MGVHHPYHLDLCADDEDPFQLIIRPRWDAPHVRCFSRTFCAWPCLLRQVGTVLGSPYDYVVARLAYANPGSRQIATEERRRVFEKLLDAYTLSLETLAQAQLEVNKQSTEIIRLKGNLFAISILPPIDNFSSTNIFTSSSSLCPHG